MKNKRKYRLVILTTHFGTDFSGGSTATHEIFSRLEHDFSEIIVICNQLGNHTFKNLTIHVYRNIFQAIWILNSLDNRATLYYGDFYNSIWLVWLKKSFIFTYHDNWPEQALVSLKNRIKALVFIPLYTSIFRQAKCVIAVSLFKFSYIKKFNPNARLIRNGFKQDKINNPKQDKNRFRIIMVGNIDKRKYSLAVPLFKKISLEKNIEIHVFGNQKDIKLADKLNNFENVRIHGFVRDIRYCDYDLFLHTSMIENLPISICEALFHEVPVIAFRVGGIPEIVNQSNGILVDPFHIYQMFNMILEVKNETFTFSFEDNDLREYSWDNASKKYGEILIP